MTGSAVLSLIALWSVSWTGTEAFTRLTGVSVPNVYYIHLEPNFTNNTFKGNVTVDFHVTIETSAIAIHQKDLYVTNITMGNIGVSEWMPFHSAEILIIAFNQLLTIHQKYSMNIVYEGVLGTNEYGFYKSNYTEGKETRWIAATRFEPTGARRAFPCWDEPQFKAVFDISITHSKIYTAVLSNMKIFNQTDNGETVTTYFDRTKRMATYSVAFMVTDYAYKPRVDDRIRIYTKPEFVEYTDYAFEFTVRALHVLDDYTDIPYFKYMPKIDQATVPGFEDSRNMENWGLLNYKEDMLLYEEGVTTTAHKQLISRTMAHEIAQQWFGNLVSPEWWDYAWLKEGFADFFAVYILDILEPTWRVMDVYVVDTMQWGSFILDSYVYARPLNRHVVNHTEIMSAVDDVSYKKGSCVLRMFSHILSEKSLRKGLRHYLQQYKFSVADSIDLLYRLNDAFGTKRIFAGRSFREVAYDWVVHPGYPLVTVTKVSPGIYSLTQERFKSYGYHKDRTKWWIPITYATNLKRNFTNTTVTHWLTPRNLTIIEADADWIVVNKQQIGYYRVNYDEDTWRTLTNVLKTDMHQIHPINRAQLIDDVFTMAYKNVTKYETALSLALYLTQEIDYVPWMTAFRNLETLRNLLFQTEHFPVFKHYIRFIMHSLTTNVTYEASPNDDHPTKILKGQAMHWACLADVKQCLDSAQKHFNAWLKDPRHKIDPDLRDTIICTGLRTASKEVWDTTRRILEKVKFDPVSKRNPLELLGCSNNREILKQFLMDSTDPKSKIDFSDAVKGVIANTNVSGIDIVQEVMEVDFDEIANLDDFEDEVTPAISVIARAIVNTNQFFKLSTFNTQTHAKLVDSSKAVQMSNRNILWVRSYSDRVVKWLVENEEVFSSSGTIEFTSFLLILSIFVPLYF